MYFMSNYSSQIFNFENRKNCVYVGPIYRRNTIESKWFKREACFTEDTRKRGADMPICACGFCIPFYHFNHTRYKSIIMETMWDQIPELYGAFVACGCYGSQCQCQAGALIEVVEKRIREDYEEVDEKQYQELRRQYLLKDEDLSLWMWDFLSYERDWKTHKERYEKYLAKVVNHK